jgi:hypothetical protein
MLLDEYLAGLDTKEAIKKASSFYDYPWRKSSGVVFLKLVPKTLVGVPAELHKDCLVSQDALHVLKVFTRLAEAVSVKELLAVLEAAGWKAADEYTPFHVRMYATSFTHMRLMESVKPEAEVQSAKDSQIVFIPVFSVNDADEKFKVLADNLKFYEVSEVKGDKPKSEAYLGLSVHEGYLHSQGEKAEEDNMTYGSF